METLKFLISNREKPRTFKRWGILLVKRSLLLRSLLRILYKQAALTKKGAKIGRLTIISEIKFDGRDLSNFSVGSETSIGRVHIALHDKVSIGDKVVLNDGVTLLTASHRLSDSKWRLKPSPVKIGDYAWIATNSIILPGVSIGKGAVVGAGAVVREDVPDYGIAVGNPAKLVEGRRRIEDLDYSPVLFNAPYEAWLGKIFNG